MSFACAIFFGFAHDGWSSHCKGCLQVLLDVTCVRSQIVFCKCLSSIPLQLQREWSSRVNFSHFDGFHFPLKTLIKKRFKITFLELGCRNPVFRADFRRLLCATLSCFAFDGCAGAFVVLVISLCCAGDFFVMSLR